YTTPPASASSATAGFTRSGVRRPRISGTRLCLVGSTCCTMATGSGNSRGRRPSTRAIACKPPAEAATVTSWKTGGDPTAAPAIGLLRYIRPRRPRVTPSGMLVPQPLRMRMQFGDARQQAIAMLRVQLPVERLRRQFVVLTLQLGDLTFEP